MVAWMVRDQLEVARRRSINAMRGGGITITKTQTDDLRNDTEIVLKAVQTDGMALRWASPPFRGDKRVVMEAVKQNGFALDYASEELKRDTDLIQEAIKHGLNKYDLPDASLAAIADDFDMVLQLVKIDGLMLQAASSRLQSDKRVVTEAVKQNGLALEYASLALKADKDVVRAAVMQDGQALRYHERARRSDNNALQYMTFDNFNLRKVKDLVVILPNKEKEQTVSIRDDRRDIRGDEFEWEIVNDEYLAVADVRDPPNPNSQVVEDDEDVRYTVGVFSLKDLLDAQMDNPLTDPTYIFIKGLGGDATKAGVVLAGDLYEVPVETPWFDARDTNQKDTRDFKNAYTNEIKLFAQKLADRLPRHGHGGSGGHRTL